MGDAGEWHRHCILPGVHCWAHPPTPNILRSCSRAASCSADGVGKPGLTLGIRRIQLGVCQGPTCRQKAPVVSPNCAHLRAGAGRNDSEHGSGCLICPGTFCVCLYVCVCVGGMTHDGFSGMQRMECALPSTRMGRGHSDNEGHEGCDTHLSSCVPRAQPRHVGSQAHAAGWHVPNAVVMPAWSQAMLTHGAAHHGGSPSLGQSRGCCWGFRPPPSLWAKVLPLAPKLWVMGKHLALLGAVAAPTPKKRDAAPH